MISRFLDGGIDTVLVEYLNNLVQTTPHKVSIAIMLKMGEELEVYKGRLNNKIDIFYLIEHPFLTTYKRKAIRGNKNAIIGLFDELLINPIRRWQTKRKLNFLAQTNDVIVDFDSCFGSYIKKEWTAKIIAFFHFSFKKELERDKRRMRRFKTKVDKYDHIVTISDAMLHEAQELYPEAKNKFTRIYNFIDPANLKQKAQEGCDGKSPFILAVERLEESQKDITTLLKAYAILKDRMKEGTPHLYIIGKGKDEYLLRQKAQELSINREVTFLGFIPNPYPWIKKATAIVHSAKFEGLPTILIESLLLDKLIVATDCPTGPKEILNYGHAGILVPPNNAQAFADAIIKITQDPQIQEEIKKDILYHKNKFMPEECIQQFESLL